MAHEVRSQPAHVASAAARLPQGTRYLPIAEHGLIGDLHTVALVGGDRADGRAARQLPQAFTHLALISAAYNLDRQLG
jgi:hypothetical protein